MATFSGYTFSQLAQVALLPVAADGGGGPLVTSQRFPSSGVFAPGDSVVIHSTQPFHILAGGDSVAATTSHRKFLAGTYKFTVPDGCTHVAMIDGSDGAGNGGAYKG